MKKTLIIIMAALMAMPVIAMADNKPAKKKGEIKEVTFVVEIDCENCAKKITENVSFEKGVKDLKVSVEDMTVALKYDSAKTTEDALKASIEELGYPVHGTLASGEKAEHHHHDHDHGHDHGHDHNHNHAH